MTYLVDSTQRDLGSVTVHKRASSIAFYNPASSLSYVNIVEEEAITGAPAGVKVETVASNLQLAFDDPHLAIPLIHPETGDALGASVTAQELFVTLFSLYIYMRELPND